MPMPSIRHRSARRAAVRRAVLLSVAVSVSGALLLTSCTGEDLGPADGAEDAETAGPVGTRRIVDARGRSVEVPLSPRRVVTLSRPTLDAALALGVEPYGTAVFAADGDRTPPYLADRAVPARVVAEEGRVRYGRLAALEPDLILVDGSTRAVDDLAALQAVAPTVVTSTGRHGWKEAFTATAEALNMASAAQQVLGRYGTELAETARAVEPELAGTGRSVGVVRWADGGLARPADGDHVRSTLESLGLRRAPGSGTDGDWVFFGVRGAGRGEAVRTFGAARTRPVLAPLAKADEEHRVAVVDGSAWEGPGGPIAARTVLNDVREAVTAPSG
ncbi:MULTISPECIES: ABC transporter substrate-binding protein [Streptomyces]|uniref:ABC transporter substrate-binding protein n=1 Tax=Streptomyces chilikensis TaxID=1194079 RepID=A0ABV3ESE0_9ACTN|nr:ABC transporter substrate-binding protein [Streptomyces sp. MJP52]MDH6223292.1 iron complex transport system substrate-binding protein [Streptomyces sp. MJP52]